MTIADVARGVWVCLSVMMHSYAPETELSTAAVSPRVRALRQWQSVAGWVERDLKTCAALGKHGGRPWSLAKHSWWILQRQAARALEVGLGTTVRIVLQVCRRQKTPLAMRACTGNGICCASDECPWRGEMGARGVVGDN